MLSVVVPAYEGAPRLRCALERILMAIERQPYEVEIVLVNDGDSASVRRCLEALPHASLKTIHCRRQGRAAARNLGAKAAIGRRILFLDADVLAADDVIPFHAGLETDSDRILYRGLILNLPWLAPFEDPLTGQLTERASRSLRLSAGQSCALMDRRLPAEAIHCPDRLRDAARPTLFERDLQRLFLTSGIDEPGLWIGCTGGHFSISREYFLDLGGFDERMGLRWGAEDLELGYRAVHAGLAVRQTECAVFHLGHDSGERGGDHEWALGYFADKHGNPGILRLLDYFGGKCALDVALEACHAKA